MGSPYVGASEAAVFKLPTTVTITMPRAEWRELVREANAAEVQAHREAYRARLLARRAELEQARGRAIP